jgi:renalase
MPLFPESEVHDVLVIGAGIAGLTAARELRAAGRRVLVLEKSRGLGGRAATRRWNGFPVDHGAQFFTARSPDFLAQVGEWMTREVCFEWSRGLHRATDQGPGAPEGDNYPRYACREGMSALGRDLAGDDAPFVAREARVESISRTVDRWEVRSEDGRTFTGRALIVTPPPPQSAALLGASAPDASAALARMSMSPCLALVARYARIELPWRGIQAPEHAVVSWIGHDTSKRPDLHPEATIVVIHAAPAFSAEKFGRNEAAVSAELLRTASHLARVDLEHSTGCFLQRWRYALGSDRSGPAALHFAGTAPLILAGDAIAGGKIEGAWQSGREAARLLAEL